MIALDTNVLVRYLIKDDRKQAVAATDFLRKNRAYLLKSVLLELVWVLSSVSGYALSREIVHERLHHLLGLPTVEAEDPAVIAQALSWFLEGMDFADALHLAGSGELSALATFDRKFASTAHKLDTSPPITLLC